MDAIWERLEEIPRAAKEMPIFDGDLPLYGLFQDVILKDKRNIPDLVRLTQLIFCARRPLSPQEAFIALDRSYAKPFQADKVNSTIISKKILAISKGLAEVTRAKEPTVQFIHDTVREFLRDGGLSTISKQSMQGDGNETLKIACLDQIEVLDSVAEHFELLADYRTWTGYRNKQDKDITVSQRKEFQKKVGQIFPFLEYATQHVLFHANAAAAQGVPQRPFLDSFPSRLWVPLHNLFEKANTKRFGGSLTPILYILAGHGLSDLVRIATEQCNYATLCQNEQCQTALHNAIYSGHFDTAWVLVGLDLRNRSSRLDEPRLVLSGCRKTLLKAIIDADDVEILRKVIRDLGVPYLRRDTDWAKGEKWPDLILSQCRSATMLDGLAEHSMLPNMDPAEENAQNGADSDGSLCRNSNLSFIRRAIDKDPKLLTGNLWIGQSMLDYAVEKRFIPLVALYFELMNSRGLATLNECVERAAMLGCLVAVKEAHSRGADLGYQDESGRTVLHKMFRGTDYIYDTSKDRRGSCSVLQYLLSSCPELGASVDRDGYTAFDNIRNDLWGDGYVSEPQGCWVFSALEIFVKAGAKTRTGFICNSHEYPWVIVPWIPIHSAMQIAGEKQSNNLDARDSLGRTALSWCYSILPGREKGFIFYFHKACRDKGLDLLKFSDVDVNSRDNSGRTILEHLIRHPNVHDYYLSSLTVAFFKSSTLDVNLETSGRHSPLELIISLYGTWPMEFGDIDAECTVFDGDDKKRIHVLRRTLKGVEKISRLSEGLYKTAQLLLGTQKVDLSEQKRCLAVAPGNLRGLILESIRQVEPDYHLPTVSDGNQ